MYKAFGKRAFDVLASAAALAVLAPVLVAIAALVRWRMGAPVLFAHVRPGRLGRPFRMLKFRTMRPPRAGEDAYATDAERLSPFGAWLRRTSLDELPELWNVLRGDMSLVGPRPLLMEYLPRYNARQARRHEVRPGITGWAQVNGRNAVSWERKFDLDVWYVDHVSLWLDLRVLALTLLRVARPEGIVSPGPFLGSSRDER